MPQWRARSMPAISVPERVRLTLGNNASNNPARSVRVLSHLQTRHLCDLRRNRLRKAITLDAGNHERLEGGNHDYGGCTASQAELRLVQAEPPHPPIAGEAEAIERAKNGDPDAFSKLYALHKRRVYTLCLRMLGNVSEAEDMTQEAFLHLFRKLGSFRGESAFSTWLHRLTVNLVLMHLRKKGLNLVSLEETINPSEEDAPKRDFGSRDPQLSGSVDRVALERAVASLPPGYRMVFVLHDVEGFEHNEIATMLECSTGNSKSQLHKARLKLRELLRQTEQLAQPTQTKEAIQ